jgi:transcriptional regulator with XRE-family HTH domain
MSDIGRRIKAARKAAALSLRDLAEQVDVSAQSISKYERGLMTPDSAGLLQLARALGVKVEYFFRTQEVHLSRPAYRKRTRLPRKQENAIVGQIQEWLERYLEVEALFPDQVDGFSLPASLPRDVSSMEEVERLAEALRREWEIGTGPIEDLIALLEGHGIKVGLVEGHDKFDACTFTIDGQEPVIVTKRDLPGDRQRMNVARELGHTLMETDAEMAPQLDPEKAAYRFAAAFLVPAGRACAELGRSRQNISAGELYILKHRYGFSMQAWLYRARDLGILTESAYRRHQRAFSAAYGRRVEPGEPVSPETPQRLHQLVHRALAEGLISQSRAAELLGESLAQFLEHLSGPAEEISVLSAADGAEAYAANPTTVRH